MTAARGDLEIKVVDGWCDISEFAFVRVIFLDFVCFAKRGAAMRGVRLAYVCWSVEKYAKFICIVL